MLRYGCTRIEIGVQSVYEDVARDTNRGHTIAAVRNIISTIQSLRVYRSRIHFNSLKIVDTK